MAATVQESIQALSAVQATLTAGGMTLEVFGQETIKIVEATGNAIQALNASAMTIMNLEQFRQMAEQQMQIQQKALMDYQMQQATINASHSRESEALTKAGGNTTGKEASLTAHQ